MPVSLSQRCKALPRIPLTVQVTRIQVIGTAVGRLKPVPVHRRPFPGPIGHIGRVLILLGLPPSLPFSSMGGGTMRGLFALYFYVHWLSALACSGGRRRKIAHSHHNRLRPCRNYTARYRYATPNERAKRYYCTARSASRKPLLVALHLPCLHGGSDTIRVDRRGNAETTKSQRYTITPRATATRRLL